MANVSGQETLFPHLARGVPGGPGVRRAGQEKVHKGQPKTGLSHVAKVIYVRVVIWRNFVIFPSLSSKLHAPWERY